MRITLEIGKPIHGGFCISRVREDDPSGLGGKVVLVTGTLPGERVVAEPVEERPSHMVARTLEVLDPSPDRVPHIWPLAESEDVGGADLGHVSQEAQLRWKEAVITDSLARIGGPEVAEAAAAVSPAGQIAVESVPGGTTSWRTRVSFVMGEAGTITMRKARSHELVALTSMPLAVPELGQLDLFSRAWHLPVGAEIRAVMPSGSAPILVMPGGVFSAPNVAAPPHVVERVDGPGGELRYHLAAGGFWQSHRAAPSTLVRAVMEGAQVSPGERVLELYSGAGLFTVPLAREVGARGTVIALEGSKKAVADARKNLRSLPQARVDVSRVDGRRIEAVGGRFETVVLDPPRSGAGHAAMLALWELAPERIVYVACDPAALARDLKQLLPDYSIESLRAFDLFPSTHHVEAVVVLRRTPR